MGVWYGPEHWFPQRHVVELDDGRILEVLEQRVVEGHDHFILQYLSDVALIDAPELDRGAQQILAIYAGPKADAESCTTIELIATEWCENGLCWWEDRTFYAKRNQDGDWFISE
jgi:hypothetical protein